ncbi:metabolite traffic protein EboE [Kriegella aquimaris]|uniref:Xylose isomerase-like TIM barrel n=1 Tax=Kriegella aquimaris TaxID=192904 RepID=A0A1G9Y337_9FLAO|nr:metabolite traffic protein EboE [Kriegella aquimaris]SDN02883.1 Xylose isomerase-like TIM barrel [Kriegella aquimaris]
MKIADAYHLSYCSNIHPGENWEVTFSNLEKFLPIIQKQVADDKPFGVGLRLSNTASEELGLGETLSNFKNWLAENNLYVFTMNGFPYGNFHNERVKDMVHAPDWSTRDRVIYTKRLFHQLAVLLPDGVTGGISTSPISYKHWHETDAKVDEVLKRGAEHLVEIAQHLFELEQSTGKFMHLDIEPEPDGLFENSDEVVNFFADYLVPIAKEVLPNKIGTDADRVEDLIKKYITVCYDICHFSLAYENPIDTFKKFAAAGITVGKIQVSAALKILNNSEETAAIWESLSQFNEPVYLHQVTEKVGNEVVTYNDLPIVLKEKKEFTELRAHFHVPIFLEKFDKLDSTQDQILAVIDYLKSNKVSEHLEIETYTWDVLPEALKTDLSDCIVREINWLKQKL